MLLKQKNQLEDVITESNKSESTLSKDFETTKQISSAKSRKVKFHTKDSGAKSTIDLSTATNSLLDPMIPANERFNQYVKILRIEQPKAQAVHPKEFINKDLGFPFRLSINSSENLPILTRGVSAFSLRSNTYATFKSNTRLSANRALKCFTVTESKTWLA